MNIEIQNNTAKYVKHTNLKLRTTKKVRYWKYFFVPHDLDFLLQNI